MLHRLSGLRITARLDLTSGMHYAINLGQITDHTKLTPSTSCEENVMYIS
jgi:hypothetical protein